MVGYISNLIGLSFFGIVFIVALIIVTLQQISGINLGILGLLA